MRAISWAGASSLPSGSTGSKRDCASSARNASRAMSSPASTPSWRATRRSSACASAGTMASVVRSPARPRSSSRAERTSGSSIRSGSGGTGRRALRALAVLMLILSICRSKKCGARPCGLERGTYARYEHKCCQAIVTIGQVPCSSGRTVDALGQGQLAARDGPLQQHIAAKAEQLGRPARRAHRELAGLLDQILLLDQAAEVLLVQPAPGQGLHGL